MLLSFLAGSQYDLLFHRVALRRRRVSQREGRQLLKFLDTLISLRLKPELSDLTFGNLNECQHIIETRISFNRV